MTYPFEGVSGEGRTKTAILSGKRRLVWELVREATVPTTAGGSM